MILQNVNNNGYRTLKNLSILSSHLINEKLNKCFLDLHKAQFKGTNAQAFHYSQFTIVIKKIVGAFVSGKVVAVNGKLQHKPINLNSNIQIFSFRFFFSRLASFLKLLFFFLRIFFKILFSKFSHTHETLNIFFLANLALKEQSVRARFYCLKFQHQWNNATNSHTPEKKTTEEKNTNYAVHKSLRFIPANANMRTN